MEVNVRVDAYGEGSLGVISGQNNVLAGVSARGKAESGLGGK